jgi:biotin transporter BioY
MVYLVLWFFLAIFMGVFIFKMQENKNKKWKYFFIILLIANLIFCYCALAYLHIGSTMWGMNFIVVAPLSLAFVIIDIIALFIYIFRRTRGMTKVLFHAVLLPTILLLIILGTSLIDRLLKNLPPPPESVNSGSSSQIHY